MTKQVLVGKGVRVEKRLVYDGKGNVVGEEKREVVETAWQDKPQGLCKECKKNQKEVASSRCKSCSNSHKVYLHNKQRLQTKIEQQNNG